MEVQECKVAAEYKFVCSSCNRVIEVWLQYSKSKPGTFDKYVKCKECGQTYMIRFEPNRFGWAAFKSENIEGSYLCIDNTESGEEILVRHMLTTEKRATPKYPNEDDWWEIA